jgi:hypothetical protein
MAWFWNAKGVCKTNLFDSKIFALDRKTYVHNEYTQFSDFYNLIGNEAFTIEISFFFGS